MRLKVAVWGGIGVVVAGGVGEGTTPVVVGKGATPVVVGEGTTPVVVGEGIAVSVAVGEGSGLGVAVGLIWMPVTLLTQGDKTPSRE